MDDDSRVNEVGLLLQQAEPERLATFLEALAPSEFARLVSRLPDEEQAELFDQLPRGVGAALLESLPLPLAEEVLSLLPTGLAAALLDRLPSDDQTDLLGELEAAQRQSVLAEMAPAEAKDVLRLSQFAPNTAGGLMATEFLAFPGTMSVSDVIADLRAHADQYARYVSQYIYVLGKDGALQGVVQLRDLLFHADDRPLGELPLRAAVTVKAEADLGELKEFFERHSFFAAPVIDERRSLLGIVTRADYDEASVAQAAQTLLRFGGIVFGEEFRSMPLLTRVGGRLAWLVATMILSFLAASVVGLFQSTLSQLIALAVFLPVISGMSGNAGNQAIAVSMRELSLGLVTPREIRWVLAKETGVGMLNGILLGFALALVALLWQGNPGLGLVVGAAQALSILLAVCVGGVVPLLLKRCGFDPAIASAPLLTTITDAAGFFLTLGLARIWLT